MRIDILTLFPDMIGAVLGESVTGRALKKNLFELNLVDIRNYTLESLRENIAVVFQIGYQII